MLRTLTVTRYVTPLREGGSVPAIVEGDDDGLYVLKFRGAGQGKKALIAELVAGEVGRALGLRVPELVLVDVDARLGRAERDEEIRDLLKASVGLNLALDYLPGSLMFDPATDQASAAEASDIVWFDAFTTNVDRTPRNPNLLRWHRDLWLIDHGAALYFHHAWSDWQQKAASPFAAVRDHVLLPFAGELPAADARLRPRLSRSLFERIAAAIPDDWLAGEAAFASVAEHRAAYVEYLDRRLAASAVFTQEAVRARGQLV